MNRTIKAKIQALRRRLLRTTIKVKQSHINNGKPRSPELCAIALAFGDAFKGNKVRCIHQHFEPGEGELSATFEGINNDVMVYCILPPPARRLARRYDLYETVKPISFKVAKITSMDSV